MIEVYDPDDDGLTLCDHCCKEVPTDESFDCVPDETGHCIRCGLHQAEACGS